MNRRKLLSGAAALAGYVALPDARAAIVTPPTQYGAAGRKLLDVIDNAAGMLDATQYGVVVDGQNGRYFASYTAGAATFSMFTLSASVTVTNVNGQANVAYPYTSNIVAPQPSDIGLNCHVPGAGAAGGDFVSPIVSYANTATVMTLTLRDPAPTTFASTTKQLTWPCFSSPSWSAGNPAWTSQVNDVGKWIRISEGQVKGGGGTFSSPVHNYQAPVFGTIATITAPNAITLAFPSGASTFGFTWPATVAFGFTIAGLAGVEVDWGTENSAALLAAATAASTAGIKDVYFPGPANGIVFALGFYTVPANNPVVYHEYVSSLPNSLIASAGNMTFRPLFQNNRLLSDGVRSRFFTCGGAEITKSISPLTATVRPVPRRKIKGSRHLTRLASLTAGSSANVVAWSASIFGVNPSSSGQSLQGDAINSFMDALRNANSGRLTFNKVSRSIGGQWMTHLDSLPTAFAASWYAVTTNPWFFYINPIPSVSGSNAAPDLVLLFEDGSNPRWQEHGPALLSVLKKIASIAALNGHTPDVLMCNCRSGSHTGNVNAGATFVGGTPQSALDGQEYACTFLETMAESLGIGFFDLFQPSAILHDGWSPRHLTTRKVAAPAVSAAVAPLVPLDLRYQRVRDYSVWITITATSGANAFTTGGAAVGMLRFTLSPKMNNDFIIGTDNATGNLTVMATSFGRWMTDTVSLNSATGVLTCNAVGQRTVSGATWSAAGAGDNLNVTAGAVNFVASDYGLPVLISTGGWQATPFLTAIADRLSSTIAILADGTTYNVGGNQTGNITIGGGLFIQKDADAQLDIVIFQGTTVLSGKITGYTSQGVVTTTITGTTLTNAAASIFVGHLSVPWTVTGQNVSADANANPTIVFSKQYGKVDVGYITGPTPPNAINGGLDAWSGEVVIWGGAFCPKVFVTNAGPCTLTPSNLRIDKKLMFTPAFTDMEFWGNATGDFDEGGGSVHPTSRQLTLLDDAVLSYQDLSVI